ncbi:isochorismatase family protein [Pseudonocardiaceae bacterium YIM PH 21723]|nr:isochorismatase family protein [Pseudonocardiaceae bacterium YIM PH 21723]
MTTLQDRPGTALLVIDVQNGVVAKAHERAAVVANIGALVERARQAGVPVVWVQHFDEDLVRGGENWRIVPELVPGERETLVEKQYRDSFEDTTLEAVLAGHQAGRLIVTGAQTDFCVRSTLHSALARGYDAILVSDAHTTEDGVIPAAQVIAHTNMYWAGQLAAGRTGGTASTAAIQF